MSGQRGAGLAWQNCSQAACASSPYLRTGIFCCFPLRGRLRIQVREVRRECWFVKIWGSAESSGPSEGTLQSGDTAQDEMPENQSQ